MTTRAHGNRRRRRLGLFVVALATAVLIVAVGAGAGSARGDASGTYVVGGMADLSAGFASIGEPTMSGLRAALEQVNRSGGVNGHKIKIVVRDDASDPARGLANIREFTTRWKASVIAGVNSSVVAGAVAPIVNEERIPLIGNGVPSNVLTPVQPYVFISQADFAIQARAQIAVVGQLIKQGKVPANPKIALMYYSTPAGTAWRDEAVKYANTYKRWQFVESQSAQIGTADYSAQVSRIQSADADVVLFFMNAAGVTPFVSRARAVGMSSKTLFVGFNSTTSPSYLRSLPWANFISLGIVRDANAKNTPGFRRMRAGAALFKIDPNTPGFLDGYVQGLLIESAFKVCGYPCPATKFKTALEKSKSQMDGITFGPYAYSAKSHSPVTLVQFEQWNPKTRVLTPIGNRIRIAR